VKTGTHMIFRTSQRQVQVEAFHGSTRLHNLNVLCSVTIASAFVCHGVLVHVVLRLVLALLLSTTVSTVTV